MLLDREDAKYVKSSLNGKVCGAHVQQQTANNNTTANINNKEQHITPT